MAGEALAHDWPEWSGVGKLVADTRLLVDILVADSRVDSARIGIIGHSLGGKMAFYTGCLDSRIKVIVASDFGIGWDQTNWRDPWYWGEKLKDLRAKGMDHAGLLSLSGGKPFCLIAGEFDDASSGTMMRRAKGYERNPERLVLVNHATGHRRGTQCTRKRRTKHVKERCPWTKSYGPGLFGIIRSMKRKSSLICSVLPAYGFYLRHADGVRFENMSVRPRRYPVRTLVAPDDCRDVDLGGLRMAK